MELPYLQHFRRYFAALLIASYPHVLLLSYRAVTFAPGMDSVTQIVLGAAVGEAALGKKVGNKAMLYGAIAGTIPDLDVLASNFTDTVTALAMHRGFTHSIVFSLAFAPVFGWLVSRYEKHKDFRGWTWLFFLGFVTHPMLDAHTTWGTQLFWPFDLRLAFQSIFVIDPLYTLPFLLCLILAMRLNRMHPKRPFFNRLGLILSTAYLAITLILKWVATEHFKSELQTQNVSYTSISTRPSPMNTILWNANVDMDDGYLLGTYSFFDQQPVTFHEYPKDHHLIAHLQGNKSVQEMIRISQGWYTVTEEDGKLYFNDLRFGLLSFDPDSRDFVFKYRITVSDSGEVEFSEEPKDQRDAQKLISELWARIKGN